MSATSINNSCKSNDSSVAINDSNLAVFGNIIIVLTIIIVGVIGNGKLLYVIWEDVRRKTFANYFICNQSCVDLVILVLLLPLSLTSISQGYWIFGNSLCQATDVMNDTLYLSTVINLTVLVFERFLVVCRNIHISFSQIVTSFIICSTWLVPLIFCYPWFHFPVTYDHDFQRCIGISTVWTEESLNVGVFIFIISKLTLFLLLPTLITCYSFYSKLKTVWRSIRRTRRVSPVVEEFNIDYHAQEAHRHSVITTAILISTVILCTIPQAIIILITALGDHEEIPAAWKTIGQYLLWLQCSLKPIIYGIRNDHCLLYIKHLFGKCCCFKIIKDRNANRSTSADFSQISEQVVLELQPSNRPHNLELDTRSLYSINSNILAAPYQAWGDQPVSPGLIFTDLSDAITGQKQAKTSGLKH